MKTRKIFLCCLVLITGFGCRDPYKPTIISSANSYLVIEGKDNTTRQLTMNGDGFYTSPNLNLALNQEYRLRIITANGKEYLSDYVVARKTPTIDSLEFRQDAKGVQEYGNTHD